MRPNHRSFHRNQTSRSLQQLQVCEAPCLAHCQDPVSMPLRSMQATVRRADICCKPVLTCNAAHVVQNERCTGTKADVVPQV